MPRLDERAAGVYIISVTPFTETGALDLADTGRLVDFYLERGATGLTILGIMGEAPKLSAAESLAFTAEVLRCTDGRVPVVVGVSSPGFAAMGFSKQRVANQHKTASQIVRERLASKPPKKKEGGKKSFAAPAPKSPIPVPR